jgi:2Fe-2S ferredoxin
MEDITIYILDREDNELELTIPADSGLNLMELCKASELPVEGTCGGMALCGSCHVYVLSDISILSPSDDEERMLDMLPETKANSRLGCQIKLTDRTNGLKVKLAPIS